MSTFHSLNSHQLQELLAPTIKASTDATISEKTIWSFWHSGDANLSDLHRLCVASWRSQNPSWDIRIIDRDNIHTYVPPSELPKGWEHIKSPPLQADAARLAVLKCYGGVYLDISVILLTNLDDFFWQGIHEKQYGYFGFYNPEFGVADEGKELVATWFMATQKNNVFIARWHEIFCQLMHNRSSVNKISKHHLLKNINLAHLKQFKDYCAINAAMKRLIDTESQMRDYWEYQCKLLNCKESGFKWRSVLKAPDWYDPGEMEGFIKSNPPEIQWTALKDVPVIKLHNTGGCLVSYTCDDLLYTDTIISRLFSKALMQNSWCQI